MLYIIHRITETGTPPPLCTRQASVDQLHKLGPHQEQGGGHELLPLCHHLACDDQQELLHLLLVNTALHPPHWGIHSMEM
jgi:hypothetical protein